MAPPKEYALLCLENPLLGKFDPRIKPIEAFTVISDSLGTISFNVETSKRQQQEDNAWAIN
jgi:hypothetical protein